MIPLARIPGDLEGLLSFSSSCSCGRVHAVELAGVSIRRGALDDVVVFAREGGRKRSVCLVMDSITRGLAGERVRRLLAGDGARVHDCLIPEGAGGRPHADEASLARVMGEMQGADLAVAVGAGTVNDLTKLASFKRGIPYLAVATAPSMNGYTSAIAAIMLQGVKRTVDCHQPRAVIADLDLICQAPLDLVAAGLGDLESKPTATADFRLAGLVRGEYHCPAPEKVVMAAEARVAEAAEGLPRRDERSLRLLTEALLLSGISMKLAGSSSPASGGEHLISHHWDMTAPAEGRVEGFHGAQVGVATLITAALYESLRRIPPDSIDVERLLRTQPSRTQWQERIRANHGAQSAEVEQEFFRKHREGGELRRELELILGRWSAIWASLAGVLRPAARIREILSAGGAPVTVRSLGLTPEHARRSLLVAREIRGRYTVLDFAASLGLLETRADEILQAAGCLAEQ